MKRKTFQKRLMAVGIQRNEAGALSREICKTMYERGNPAALGVCLVAHIMNPIHAPIQACENYFGSQHAMLFLSGNGHVLKRDATFGAAWMYIRDVAESREHGLYYKDEVTREINADLYPDLGQCLKRLSDAINRSYASEAMQC